MAAYLPFLVFSNQSSSAAWGVASIRHFQKLPSTIGVTISKLVAVLLPESVAVFGRNTQLSGLGLEPQ